MAYTNSLDNVNINQPVRTLTAVTNTVLVSDVILEVLTSTATSVVLPTASASNTGKLFVIKDVSGTASINNITISSNGSSIDGSLSVNISASYGFYQIVSDGANYFTIASYNQNSGLLQNNLVFSTAGTFTYTPSLSVQYVLAEVIGGGGGGGSSLASASFNAVSGGGGGGGEYARGTFSIGALGTSQIVTVGNGGTTSALSAGGTGGTSSLGSLISAFGGGGGGMYPLQPTPEWAAAA